MKINPMPVVAKGRLIQNPKVAFANGETDPRTSGRWDLKGKKFLNPNPVPLKSWGVCVMQSGRFPADQAAVQRFIGEFAKSYTNHGGKLATMQPPIFQASSPDPGKAVEECWNKTGNTFQTRPQILIFILHDKNTTTYGRIKKSAECRYGVVTQCMQYSHVQKCQPQYISNVLMKFNAKLGGATARAIGPQSAQGVFRTPTMVIGADISHPPPASQGAPADEQKSSTAAITVSMDRFATRYASAVNTNGFRVEMMQTDNWSRLLAPLLQEWKTRVGGGSLPRNIIYFRDGVSEGQFSSVINQEVFDIKALLHKNDPSNKVEIVVIVASKRHHIRFFPKDNNKDRNDNPLPGTLVETAVTHPYENDFFLCSHSAIKGTARPTHYHVLMNEPKLPNEQLQTMIYEHCYQYIRSTTPVSLFPAVYYADIAAMRAKHHDKGFGGGSNERDSRPGDRSSGRSPGGSRSGSRSGSRQREESESSTPSHIDDLMTMPNDGGINTTMWFI